MKQAVIDIGSNSLRLTLYAVDEEARFKILFREKIMAGLAGYVEKGQLSQEGIRCAVSALLEFQTTLEMLDISHPAVFATASLRNIENTKEALAEIENATGLSIEILSGEEEAQLGYLGAMEAMDIPEGVFADIGGASTEVVTFRQGAVEQEGSFPVGSLSLYRSCVKKLLPGEGGQKRIRKVISAELSKKLPEGKYTPLIGVGGTCRAVLKMAQRFYGLPQTQQSVTREQLDCLCNLLRQGDKQAIDLILRTEPERIHTLVPGILILRQIMAHFQSEQLIVCKYGVREGYLCQKILSKSTTTPKTEN